jgi:midasin (ATPase involved in ribosome maturation)
MTKYNMNHNTLVLSSNIPHATQVGQIGVLKFGGPEGAVPLHSLTHPFSDAAGPGIMSGLSFDQVRSRQL